MNTMAEDKVTDAVDVASRSPRRTSVPATAGDSEDLIVALQDRVREDTSLPYLLDLVDMAYGTASTAQLCVLYAGSRLLVWARSQNHTDEFAEFRKVNGIGGETVEGQVADIILRRDPEYDDKKSNTIRSRRSYYANAMGWFADPELCTFSGGQMLTDARKKGGIKGIAAIYAEQQKKIAADERVQRRTANATAKREENRRKAEEDKQAKEAAKRDADERVTREHAEAEERRRRQKIEAAKAALMDDAPLAPPLATFDPVTTAETMASETNPEFRSRAADAPSVEMEHPEGDGENAGEDETEAQAEEDGEDEAQPAPLADILDYLGTVRRDDRGWALADAAASIIEQDGIVADAYSKVRAPISVMVQIADGALGNEPTRYTVVDFDLCVEAVVKLIEERRMIAEIAAQKDAAD